MEDMDRDRQRAEVFDALGHPTRISILKILSDEPLGFADLKKRMGTESSGHLQHHLSKLNGLIKTDEHGKYCLSDQGKDALFTVQTVKKALERGAKENGRLIRAYSFKTRTILTSIIALLTLISLFTALYASSGGLIQPFQAGENLPLILETGSERTAMIFLRPIYSTSVRLAASVVLFVSSLAIGALCIYLVNRKH